MKRTLFKGLSVLAASLLLALGLIGPVVAEEGYVVIVNPGVKVESIGVAELSKLFLKKTTRWEDGATVAPVDQVSDTAVRESFSQDIHGKSVTAIKAYWQQQIFSGRAVPPPEMSSDQAVVNFVRDNTGAIGYVGAGTKLEGVKTISISR